MTVSATEIGSFPISQGDGSKKRNGRSQRDRRPDMRLEALESGADPERERTRLGCHGEHHGIVNNQRKLIWQFRCTYTHSVSGRPGRARFISDLMMPRGVAERASPPVSRAEGRQKW